MALAVQINSSVAKASGKPLRNFLIDFADILISGK
jgi:hypothetical protein